MQKYKTCYQIMPILLVKSFTHDKDMKIPITPQEQECILVKLLLIIFPSISIRYDNQPQERTQAAIQTEEKKKYKTIQPRKLSYKKHQY